MLPPGRRTTIRASNGTANTPPAAKRPTFINIAHLPHNELVEQLKQSSTRTAILNETDTDPDPKILFDGMSRMIQSMLHRLYPMGEIPDYEPDPTQSFVSIAETRNTTPEAVLDYMLENDGYAMGMMPIFNVDGNHDVIREMLLHPQAVSGLSDGGALRNDLRRINTNIHAQSLDTRPNARKETSNLNGSSKNKRTILRHSMV